MKSTHSDDETHAPLMGIRRVSDYLKPPAESARGESVKMGTAPLQSECSLREVIPRTSQLAGRV
jgi:hypothetical protein